MPDQKPLTPQLHGVDEESPQRVTNDELYRGSTQYRYWSFTQDSLNDLRVRVNKKGEQTFNERISSLDDNNESNLQIKMFVSEDFSPMTVEEEREIITYYARKCHDLSNFFKFSTQVRLTAVSYLFKFYLVHSVMDYYPQQIMYTCLFLSAKSENNFLGIMNFSNAIPKTTPESILKYEYLILDSMRFSLMCHHAMKPLYGFYLDIQNVLIKLDFSRLCKDYEASRKVINNSVFTDVQFMYTPSQIALAALYIVDDVVCMRYLMRKFGVKKKQMVEMMEDRENEKIESEGASAAPEEVKAKFGNGATIEGNTSDRKEEKSPLDRFNKVMDYIKDCATMMQQTVDPTVQTAKIISLKAHFCLDPVRYFRKINKDTTFQPSSASSGELPTEAGVKRELDGTLVEENIVKRVKIEQ